MNLWTFYNSAGPNATAFWSWFYAYQILRFFEILSIRTTQHLIPQTHSARRFCSWIGILQLIEETITTEYTIDEHFYKTCWMELTNSLSWWRLITIAACRFRKQEYQDLFLLLVQHQHLVLQSNREEMFFLTVKKLKNNTIMNTISNKDNTVTVTILS